MLVMVFGLAAVNAWQFGWWAGALLLLAAKGAFFLGFYWPSQTPEPKRGKCKEYGSVGCIVRGEGHLCWGPNVTLGHDAVGTGAEDRSCRQCGREEFNWKHNPENRAGRPGSVHTYDPEPLT